MTKEQELKLRMISYDRGDPARIQHFIKVYTFAVMIGEGEQLPEDTMEILRAAALVHDIGIKAAEEKYESSDGRLQEKEGPPIAREMLTRIGYSQEVVERVCYLVGHHHTYVNMDGMDYQILVEADFLVNLYENSSTRRVIHNVDTKIFRTASGKKILHEMFAMDEKDSDLQPPEKQPEGRQHGPEMDNDQGN